MAEVDVAIIDNYTVLFQAFNDVVVCAALTPLVLNIIPEFCTRGVVFQELEKMSQSYQS